MKKDLLNRLIFGTIYVILFLLAILLSKKSYIALISIFATISLWEFTRIIKFKNIIPFILLPASIYFFIEYAISNVIFYLLLFTLLCSARLLLHLFTKDSKYPIDPLSKLDLCLRYIILPFSFTILLPLINGEYQPNIIIFILVLIWTNDSFAYLTGKNFGKRKLFERVSPKKTIEGFIGGLIFSVLLGIVIGIYFHTFGILHWIIIALLVSILGTLGDLIESKFKRQANIKDSGNIMPGHGGILDRLDSFIFITPFIYLYIHYIVNFL